MKVSGLGVGFVATALVTIALNLGIAWGAVSLVTSVVKAATDNCGKTYVIEKAFAGNWFCESNVG